MILAAVPLLGAGCATTTTVQEAPPADNALPREVQETEELPRTRRDGMVNITGVVLHFSRLTPDTMIILPQASIITEYLRNEPFTTRGYPTEGVRANKFHFSLQVNTTAAPPFALDRDRYLYPELYE